MRKHLLIFVYTSIFAVLIVIIITTCFCNVNYTCKGQCTIVFCKTILTAKTVPLVD